MIAVIDSGVANLTSVMAALQRLGAEAKITSDAADIRAAERVILPGVGAAAPAMAKLKAKKLPDVLRGLQKPLLGICLGMQLLFNRSDEGEGVDCLGIFSGEIAQMKGAPDMPIPHMGWNKIYLKDSSHPLLSGVEEGSYVYFVHSYAAPVSDYTLATADYGETFTAVAGMKNFFGCQFHPERSGAVGSRILANFLGI